MNTETSNLQEYISKRIRLLRLEKGMTQEQLEEKADLAMNYVYKLENLSTNITIKTLEKVINALDSNIETFFDIQLYEDDKQITSLVDNLKSLPKGQRERVVSTLILLINEMK